MRLKSFRIKNFKSITDTGECHLAKEDNLLVLAGQNEAGKSAVVEALNFFGNGADDDFERLFRRRDESPEVICRFLLNDTDIENIFIETKNDKLKKYLKSNPIISFRRGNSEEDDYEDVYFTDEQVTNLEPYFVVAPKEAVVATPATVPAKPEDVPSIIDIDGLEQFIWNETRNFVFYDAFSDLLPGVVTIEDLADYPAVQDFEKVFSIKFANVVKEDPRTIGREEIRLNKNATDNLNTYWKQRLEEGGEYNFNVKILPNSTDPLKSQIEFKIDRNDGDPLYLEQKSKGFRWFSAFNLRLRAMGVEDVKIKNLVILVDEPGQGLHEKAQRDVKLVLEELAKKGAQLIYTTHHPNLIGTEGMEFARIRVVSNTQERGTKVETTAQYASRAEQGAKDTLSPVITAMGIHSVHSLLDTKRLNVVVEGISDHYYLSAFKKLYSKDDRLNFLPACGVNNVPNLVSVLIGWGCNYKAVFDNDPKAGRTAFNLLKSKFYEGDETLAKEHILQIPNCDGMEDIFSRKDFFEHVLNTPLPKTKVQEVNSKLTDGKKELLARLFLDKVESGTVTLSKESEKRITEVFDWLYSKFKIDTNPK